MQRLRVYDVRLDGRLGNAVGICQDDIAGYCRYLNAATRRLLFCKEAGEESWNGTFAEIAFTVTREVPFVTTPREVARLEFVDVCTWPVEVQNQFFEYLRFGNGRLPKLFHQGLGGRACHAPQVLSRNNVPTFTDLTGPPQFIRIYITDPQDVGKRILMQGTDGNGNVIYSQDVLNRVTGIYTSLDSPFATVAASGVPVPFNSISGIQKDVTVGPVQIYQVDPTTGTQLLLSTMEPTETTAWYRRYYFSSLPVNCCFNRVSGTTDVRVTAIAKIEPENVSGDTDYLLLQNLEAYIEEAQAVRYSTMDGQQARQNEVAKHKLAVGYLNGELSHVYGKDNPAVNLALFGSARLERQAIGQMI
jgi:hypothetical protein